MKYKKLNLEQIKISLDRLTRFKYTKEKYLRVFFDIILGNLIEPKIKKSELLNMDFVTIRNIAEKIINDSIGSSECTFCSNINIKLKDYENSIFINDEETQALLGNKIDYNQALNLLEGDLPVNLKWLKSLSDDGNMILNREKYFLKYPIEKVILVEGLTEEILLPAFSRFLGYDFYQKGIQVIAAGGKNQVVKMYYKLINELRIPIFLLLDKDAEDNINQIKPKLRTIDKIHLVSCGEFEDLLPKSLIIKTINNHLNNFNSIKEADLEEGIPTAKSLEYIFKTKGLHEFKKSEFAKMVKNNISDEADISTEIHRIIDEIKF